MTETSLSETELLKAEVARLWAALKTIGTQTNRPPSTAEEAYRRLSSIGADVRQALGLRKNAVIPLGWDKPLPPVPDVVEFTAEDLKRASDEWDELMPEYAGLLNAQVVNSETPT